MVQNANLLEKKLDFYSKTTRQNKKNEYTTPPPNFLQICGQLLRYFTKISPRRAKSTPAGNFCLCLVLASPICKKDYYKGQTAQLFYKQSTIS